MYRHNKDWSDVKEIPQDDSVPIVSIRYSDECKTSLSKNVTSSSLIKLKLHRC